MTNRVNWGARGASLALRDMLDSSFPTVEALPGRYADEVRVPVGTFLPEFLAVPLLRRRGRNRLLSAYHEFERATGTHPDFIDENPKASAERIINNKKKDGIRVIYKSVQQSDSVVVDGNGDLIFRENPGRITCFNLAVTELAHSLGRKVHYVNSIFSDCPVTGHNSAFFDRAVETLSKCSTVTLRDPRSVHFAEEEAPELEVEYIPDSLFHWYGRLQEAEENLPDNGDFLVPFPREKVSRFGQISFDDPYICIAGGSRAAWNQEEAVGPYTELVREINTLGLNVYLTPTCSGDEFMYEVAARTDVPIIPAETPILMAGAIVAGATVFVTGRYHPSIFASFGGTPCVFLGADSHKTRSIQDVLQYEEKTLFSALPDEQEVEEICKLAEQYLGRGDSLRSDIRSTAKECAESARRVVDLIE